MRSFLGGRFLDNTAGAKVEISFRKALDQNFPKTPCPALASFPMRRNRALKKTIAPLAKPKRFTLHSMIPGTPVSNICICTHHIIPYGKPLGATILALDEGHARVLVTPEQNTFLLLMRMLPASLCRHSKLPIAGSIRNVDEHKGIGELIDG